MATPTMDAEDLARRGYELYREARPSAKRWSELHPDERAVLIFMAHYLRAMDRSG